jgi:hypothetical protein
MNEYPLTESSIAAAKAYLQAARDEVFTQTGVRILDDGTPTYFEPCRECAYVAVSDTASLAAELLVAHVTREHVMPALRRRGFYVVPGGR